MTDSLWHLEALGLPPHADGVAVRRAYAARLRQLDPAADPAAFQQLRAAYEAAQSWCDEQPDTEGLDRTSEEQVSHPAMAQAAPAQDDAATDAMRRLAEGLVRIDADGIPAFLDEILASLRLGYIDSPGQFEDLFIDGLRHTTLARRAELFDAASAAFNWHEVGHLRARDPRAEWIARVLSQREAWLSLESGWRSTWLGLLARAQERMDDALVRRWPDIDRLHRTLPDWLTLHLNPAEREAWQAAFERLPDAERDECQRRAAPASAVVPKPSRKHRPRIPPTAWAIGWFALMLCYLIGNALFTVSKRGGAEPLPDFRQAPLSPSECMALYARFEQPDPFAGMPASDVIQIKRRAQRCALDGHWKPAAQ